jgi:hypothetical protein
MVVEPSSVRRFDLARLLRDWGEDGSDLLTATLGLKALGSLEREVREVPDGGTLTLDFSGISVMDASFANASVLELAARLADGRYGDRYLVLDRPSESTLFNLESAIMRRPEANLALLARDGKRTHVITRSMPPNLAQAWALALQERRLTARFVADRLKLEINAASTRLHKLHAARLLARREEVSPAGRQHIYSVPS